MSTLQGLIDHLDFMFMTYTNQLRRQRRERPSLIPVWIKNAKNYREWRDWVINQVKLEHHKSTTVGLYATDRPDLIPDDIKHLFFKITYED